MEMEIIRAPLRDVSVHVVNAERVWLIGPHFDDSAWIVQVRLLAVDLLTERKSRLAASSTRILPLRLGWE